MATIRGSQYLMDWIGDNLAGKGEDDLIYGYGGNDTINGNGGNDDIYAGWGDDSALGGEGDDLLAGGDGKDVLKGEGDNDYILGQDGDDRIFGGSGLDVLEGGAGDDLLDGGENDDTLIDYSGDNTFRGGNGSDTIDYFTFEGRVNVNLNAGTARAELKLPFVGIDNLFGSTGDSTVTGIEGVQGGKYNDTITGNGDDNQLFGNNGHDQLSGLLGNDFISGGDGNDTINGGQGADIIYTGSGADVVVFDSVIVGATLQNMDVVRDFNPMTDQIHLDNAFFTALGREGALSANAFHDFDRTGPFARDADDRIIYDNVVGDLYYDADGSGAAAAVWIARFENRPNLSVSDFIII